MGQGLRKGKKRNERVRLGTGHGTAGQPVVRPGCSLFSGHQRATHAWLNRPRAQAPDWHQDRALKPLWSPGLTRVPLPCSSLQCLLFGPQRGGSQALVQLPKPPFCLPWDAGVSALFPPRTRVPVCFVGRSPALFSPSHTGVSSELLPYRGIHAKGKVTLAWGPAVRKGAGDFPRPGQALRAGGADRTARGDRARKSRALVSKGTTRPHRHRAHVMEGGTARGSGQRLLPLILTPESHSQMVENKNRLPQVVR